MSSSSPSFDVGDSVRVNEGIKDSDYPDSEIGGWQGRIVEITDEDPPMLLVEWDSVTLQETSTSILKEAEREGLDWTRYYLDPRDVEAVDPRDAPQDVKRARREIHERVQWSHVDDEEEQYIRNVLSQTDADDERAILQAWE